MKIIKRNHSVVDYDPEKIYKAIVAAYKSTRTIMSNRDYDLCQQVTSKIDYDIKDLENDGLRQVPINVVQSLVENRLLDMGLFHVYENYVEYRIQRDLDRYGYGKDHYAKFTLGRY